ncbi:MAG: putative metallo-dependent phosphatase [Acidimicrobiia bacterium]|nr:putative metallo-dependent phosphatase [Acidimicrobiia bacterium]
MRVGIVSDIHCNIEALRLALDRMGDVDELLCAGDSMYEYRFSNEVVELLRDRRAHCVLGNHDIGILAPQGERARSMPGIKPENVEYLASRPLTMELDLDGKSLLLTHGSAVAPFMQYVYPHSPELKRFAEVDVDYIVIGHTHVQMAQRVGRPLVINPGSTGDARDHSNGRRLSYAVLDTATDDVMFDNFLVGDSPVRGS